MNSEVPSAFDIQYSIFIIRRFRFAVPSAFDIQYSIFIIRRFFPCTPPTDGL